MMSFERSASLSGSVNADFAMRLELGTERQKRQLAEERLRHLEEKCALNQSGTSLLSAAVLERQAADEECDKLRSCADELRQDNETLASMVERLSKDCKEAEQYASDTAKELESKQRDLIKVRAELKETQLSRQRLEDRLNEDAQQLSMLAAALGEKDTSLSDLQVHFKSLAEKLRMANEQRAMTDERNQQLTAAVNELERQLLLLRRAQETLVLTHQETSRRFATMLMKEESFRDVVFGQWTLCTREWIPLLESDLNSVSHSWTETKDELDLSQAALERTISECQRRRGTPKANQTDMTALDIVDIEHERDAATLSLQRATERNVQLEGDCRGLAAEVEARKDALTRLHSRRKTPSVHALSHSAGSSPNSRPRDDPSSYNAQASVELDSMYHRGEALVLKQRMEAMMQRLLGQTEEYEHAMKENETLKEEVMSLRQELDLKRDRQANPRRASPDPPHGERDRVETFTKCVTSDMIHALEKRIDLAERQLLDAKQRIHDTESERDRALRDVGEVKRHNTSLKADLESYRSSLDELQSYARSLESTRVPRDIHQQELQCAQSAATDVAARFDAAQKQLASERQKRMELEEEVNALKSLQSLSTLQEANKHLQEERDVLLRSIDDVRADLTHTFELELEQRDMIVSDAAKRLIEASHEIDALEYEKHSVQRECSSLRARIEAMLTLQERSVRSTF